MKMRVAGNRSKRTWPLAVTALLLSGALSFAADDPEKKRPITTQSGAATGDLQTFEGHLVSLFSYLHHGSPMAGESKDAPERQPAAGSRPGETLNQPVGLVTKGSGILGLGSNTEFRLLVWDPQNPASQTAYQQAQRIAATATSPGRSAPIATLPAGTDDPTREYVRNPAETGQARPDQERQPAASGQHPSGKSIVKVTGKLMERDGVQAILVSSVAIAPAETSR